MNKKTISHSRKGMGCANIIRFERTGTTNNPDQIENSQAVMRWRIPERS